MSVAAAGYFQADVECKYCGRVENIGCTTLEIWRHEDPYGCHERPEVRSEKCKQFINNQEGICLT